MPVVRRALLSKSLFGGLLLLAAACQEFTEPTTDPGMVNGSLSVASAEANPISLSVVVHGSMRPNTPLNVQVVTAAKRDSETKITIHAPEIEAAKRSGWGASFRRPVGVSLPAAYEWRGQIRGNGESRISTSVSYPVPGYYRIAARAERQPTGPEIGTDELQNVAYAEAWVWIDDNGGRVTDKFDMTLFGDSLIAQPGPRRQRPRSTATSATKPEVMASMSTQLNYSYYRVVYWNADAFAYTGVPRAQAVIRTIFYDLSTLQFEERSAWAEQTGMNGEFNLECNMDQSGRDEFHVSFNFLNEDIWLRGPTYSTFLQSASACPQFYSTPDQRLEVEHIGNGDAHLFKNLTLAAMNGKAFFGRSRPRLEVSFIMDPIQRPFYDKPFDMVRYKPDRIWGSGGVRTAAHEYGHAFHEKALGGMPEYLSLTCLSHNFFSEEFNNCAYNEGFANFFAMVTRGSEAESFDLLRGLTGQAGTDGSRVEAYVAAFLYDLIDADSEPFDQVTVSGPYLAEVMSTCRFLLIHDWERANGIGHLIFCIEGAVDPVVNNTPHYFTDDMPPAAISVSVPPAAPKPAVRTLWRKVLYGETAEVPPPPPTLAATINGPSSIPLKSTYTWEAMPTGGNGSYSYSWSVYYPYTAQTVSLGTSKSVSLVASKGDRFDLTVVVTSGGQSVTVTRSVGAPIDF